MSSIINTANDPNNPNLLERIVGLDGDDSAIKVIGYWVDNILSSPGFLANYSLWAIKAAATSIMRDNRFEFGGLNIL